MAAVDLMNDIVVTVATEYAFNSPGFNGGGLQKPSCLWIVISDKQPLRKHKWHS
ncbi:MAG: hypothetical protein N0E48_21725 [Candidatus Thiodiazotropha endolucinida]|nr:hypothetical protein [Candidatus Thiodiazotropha endolucinida]